MYRLLIVVLLLGILILIFIAIIGDNVIVSNIGKVFNLVVLIKVSIMVILTKCDVNKFNYCYNK